MQPATEAKSSFNLKILGCSRCFWACVHLWSVRVCCCVFIHFTFFFAVFH